MEALWKNAFFFLISTNRHFDKFSIFVKKIIFIFGQNGKLEKKREKIIFLIFLMKTEKKD